MSDDDLDYWITRGQTVTKADDTASRDRELVSDVVLLWNVVGALGAKVLELEARSCEF